jgi:alpha-L-rhamnosidase
MDYLERSADGFILDYGIDDHKPVTTITNPDILSTGYFYDLSVKMTEMAGILRKNNDVEHYLELSENIKSAFNKRFLDVENGIYGNGGQTSMAGAVYFNIVPDNIRDMVVENLLKEIEKQEYHIDAGVVGTRYMLKAMSDIGFSNIMYEIANQKDFPGWGYWIGQGATTLWQTWKGDMSLNHIMFGSIGAWFYSVLGGIKYDKTDPGMGRFIIKPEVIDSLEWVNCEYESLYGTIISQWKHEGEKYEQSISVPFNSYAELYLPKKYGDSFTELLGNNPDFNYRIIEEDENYWMLELKPGEFVFSVEKSVQ